MKKLKFTTKTTIALYAMLAVVLSGCSNNTNEQTKAEPREQKELIFETAHCRYYCLGRNGFGNCKIVVCECDSGFTGDASVSW